MENTSKNTCLNGNYFHIFVSLTETNLTMRKEKKKKPKYNQVAIQALVDLYGLGNYYIRQCVSGSKKGITPDKIRKDYKELEMKLQKVQDEAVEAFTKN